MKEELRGLAAALGVDALAVADARPFDAEREVLERRRRLGLESPFEDGDLERRCRPERLLPGVRAIVVAAVSYRHPYPAPPAGHRGGAPRGVVSRYAWGEDYHRVLRTRLVELARFLERSVPGAACAVLVDTGPLVERAVAARAGLGWVGKNCCLIVPGVGSWVFLGEILTTAPLEPDRPAASAGATAPAAAGAGCGACDRCLRACPTGALVAPGVLDHRRCLSYATQMGGVIPKDLRSALGRRVWGCDTCQEACPHNRVAGPEAGRAPGGDEAAYDRVRPPLPALAELTREAFRRTFASTAAGWRGRHTLRRNALVALGNAADPVTLPVLARAVGDGRRLIRLHAAWALGRLAASPAAGAGVRAAAVAVLRRALAREADPEVRAELAEALEGAPWGEGREAAR